MRFPGILASFSTVATVPRCCTCFAGRGRGGFGVGVEGVDDVEAQAAALVGPHWRTFTLRRCTLGLFHGAVAATMRFPGILASFSTVATVPRCYTYFAKAIAFVGPHWHTLTLRCCTIGLFHVAIATAMRFAGILAGFSTVAACGLSIRQADDDSSNEK